MLDFVIRRVGLGELPIVTLGLPIAPSLLQQIGAREIAVQVLQQKLVDSAVRKLRMSLVSSFLGKLRAGERWNVMGELID